MICVAQKVLMVQPIGPVEVPLYYNKLLLWLLVINYCIFNISLKIKLTFPAAILVSSGKASYCESVDGKCD